MVRKGQQTIMADLNGLFNEIASAYDPAQSTELAGWIRASRRFESFISAYERKIRARLKAARGEESFQALWAELKTAAVLLSDRQFTVEYEKYASTRQRSPDFTVTFKTHTPFNVEVRRMRADPLAEARIRKLRAVICDKTGQMQGGIINLLWLMCEDQVNEGELLSAALALRQRAEHKTDDFFQRYGFRDAADFLKHYRWLSGVMLWQQDPVLWLNPLARQIVQPDLVKALRRLTTL